MQLNFCIIFFYFVTAFYVSLSVLNKMNEVSRTQIFMLGDQCVGKTAIWYAYENGGFYNLNEGTFGLFHHNFSETNIISGKEYKLTVYEGSGCTRFEGIRSARYKFVDVFIIVFAVNSLQSYQNAINIWIPEMKRYCPTTPLILVGNKTDLRDDEKSSRAKEMITTEMGKQLAKKINADKYLECSCKHLTGIENVIQEAVLATNYAKLTTYLLKQRNLLLKIRLLGDSGVGKTDILRRFECNNSLNVVGERLDRLMCPFCSFSSFVEIDGEECGFFIWDGSWNAKFTPRDRKLLQNDLDIDVCIVIFSVADPFSYISVENKWISEIKQYCPRASIVLVGNKTDLRNHSQQYVTTEMGEKLGCRINAKKYLECSSSAAAEVENLFKETVLAVLRQAEEKLAKKPPSASLLTLLARKLFK